MRAPPRHLICTCLACVLMLHARSPEQKPKQSKNRRKRTPAATARQRSSSSNADGDVNSNSNDSRTLPKNTTDKTLPVHTFDLNDINSKDRSTGRASRGGAPARTRAAKERPVGQSYSQDVDCEPPSKLAGGVEGRCVRSEVLVIVSSLFGTAFNRLSMATCQFYLFRPSAPNPTVGA